MQWIMQELKELDHYLNDLSRQTEKDAGNLWIQFTDKFTAFKKRLEMSIDHLEEGCNERDKQIDVLIKSLERITEPIKFMRSDLKEGEQLNGQYAIQLSNDPEYLKSIARKALSEFTKPQP